jgi:SAM-dependent methyltransferase
VNSAVDAWECYAGRTRPRREMNAAGATTWFNWTQYPDHGPNESVFGDVRGRTVLELGSGSGANLAHLAMLGADCVGVDIAPSREVVAKRKWGGQPKIAFVTADVVDYLTTTEMAFDIVFSVFGAVWFTEPAILLPLVRRRMTMGGLLAFSHVATVESGAESGRVIRKWNYSAERWVRLLTAAGFGDVHAEVIAAPTGDKPGTLFVQAVVG